MGELSAGRAGNVLSSYRSAEALDLKGLEAKPMGLPAVAAPAASTAAAASQMLYSLVWKAASVFATIAGSQPPQLPLSAQPLWHSLSKATASGMAARFAGGSKAGLAEGIGNSLAALQLGLSKDSTTGMQLNIVGGTVGLRIALTRQPVMEGGLQLIGKSYSIILGMCQQGPSRVSQLL